jgi:hypothetical protein
VLTTLLAQLSHYHTAYSSITLNLDILILLSSSLGLSDYLPILCIVQLSRFNKNSTYQLLWPTATVLNSLAVRCHSYSAARIPSPATVPCSTATLLYSCPVPQLLCCLDVLFHNYSAAQLSCSTAILPACSTATLLPSCRADSYTAASSTATQLFCCPAFLLYS